MKDNNYWLIKDTPYIDFPKIFSLAWIICVIISGRNQGKTFGYWSHFFSAAFPTKEAFWDGEIHEKFGSIVGNLLEVTTTDMQKAAETVLLPYLDTGQQVELTVRKSQCYLRIISINSKGFKEVYYEQCIGVYAALSQPNTMRRIGEQGITIVLIEECNPEKENHPFVGNDTSKLASIIKSITKGTEDEKPVRILAIGNQQLFPSAVLKFLSFDESDLGFKDERLFLMLDRPAGFKKKFENLIYDNSDYDNFSKRKLRDITELKEHKEVYIEKFKTVKPTILLTNSQGISLVGWATMVAGKEVLFTCSDLSGVSEYSEMLAYELSPFVAEKRNFLAQLEIVRRYYYLDSVVVGKDDRDSYYSLNTLGCIPRKNRGI